MPIRILLLRAFFARNRGSRRGRLFPAAAPIIPRASGFHAVPYGTHEIASNADVPERLGDLSLNDLKRKLRAMEKYSAIELELSATLVYMRDEDSSEPTQDVARLKPLKATAERLRRAQE